MDARSRPGRLLVYTGDGKGKTTAALGLVLRAVGHGRRCLVLQFVKGDPTTGEISAVSRLPGVTLEQNGLGFIPPADHSSFEAHRARARAGLQRAKDALSRTDFDLVVLDEVCVAVSRGLLEERDLFGAIDACGRDTCLVLTGRGASAALLARADTATEMRCLRHALQQGRIAERGIEW